MADETKNKILVVEDEPSLRGALSDKLTLEGFTVLEAKDGEEGLEIALRDQPDLILLDVIMPKMDGMTMLKKLQESAWGKKAKVIMLTNLNDLDKVSEALMRGSYDYLVKSDWKIDDVVARVRQRLNS